MMVIPYILLAIITTNQISAIKVIGQVTMSCPTSSTEISIMCAQDLRDPREGRCGGAAELRCRGCGRSRGAGVSPLERRRQGHGLGGGSAVFAGSGVTVGAYAAGVKGALIKPGQPDATVAKCQAGVLLMIVECC